MLTLTPLRWLRVVPVDSSNAFGPASNIVWVPEPGQPPTWHIVVVDSAGSVGQYPSLEVVNGKPAISYWDSANDSLKYVRATVADGSEWEIPIVLDTGGGRFTSLEVVADNPAVGYYDNTNGALKFATYF